MINWTTEQAYEVKQEKPAFFESRQVKTTREVL